jgi:hypothetical protein
MIMRGLGLMFLAVGATASCGGSVSNIGTGSDAGGRDAMSHPLDGGTRDGAITPETSSEASSETSTSEAMTTQPYDGTTGKACSTNADCKSPDGPGLTQCSSSVFAPDDYYPTAVCIVPTCSPVSEESSVHYCDGPDDPSSPGMCVPFGTTGAGKCLPKCTYDTTGDAPSGCQGKDTCRAANFVGIAAAGYGYCWAGCTADGDCPAGQQCQTNTGTCLAGLVPPTKSIGQACTETDDDDGACFCLYGGTSETGYCTSFCIVGDDTTCPGGYVCGADELRAGGYSTQNPGMYGRCHAQCTAVDAGTADGGSMCPTNSTCTDIYAAGPYCIVP